jgi:hypothetical protein
VEQDSNPVIALKIKDNKIGVLSHGFAFHEETMKIDVTAKIERPFILIGRS